MHRGSILHCPSSIVYRYYPVSHWAYNVYSGTQLMVGRVRWLQLSSGEISHYSLDFNSLSAVEHDIYQGSEGGQGNERVIWDAVDRVSWQDIFCSYTVCILIYLRYTCYFRPLDFEYQPPPNESIKQHDHFRKAISCGR